MTRGSRSTVALAALVLGAPAARAQTADVQIIHNSPDPLAATVDIYLDGALAIDDLGFREATGVTPLPAGVEITIGVAPGSSTGPGDILATFPFTLDSSESYVVMAAGVLDPSLPDNPEAIDTAFDLYVKTGLRQAGVGSDVDLLAFHGAPDAPTVDVGAAGVGTLFGSLAFTDFSGDYLSVPPAAYTLTVAPSADPGNVVAQFNADLSGLGGGAAVVFASGFLGAAPGLPEFGLFAALPTGTVVELPPLAVPTVRASWSELKGIYGGDEALRERITRRGTR